MNVRAGDVIAVEGVTGHSRISELIKAAQLRRGYTHKQARVTHIAVCINHHGNILEAQWDGIRLWNLQRYDEEGIKYHVLRHNTADPELIANLAMKLSKHDDEYRSYDYSLIIGLFFVSIKIMPLAWLKIFNNKNRAICSEFVLEVFVKAGIIVRKIRKLYFPAEWMNWTGEGFFHEIR